MICFRIVLFTVGFLHLFFQEQMPRINQPFSTRIHILIDQRAITNNQVSKVSHNNQNKNAKEKRINKLDHDH